MSDNGRHEPVIDVIVQAGEPEPGPVEDDGYEALLEMDRLEELLEAMGELGAATRLQVEALPVSPMAVEVIAELNALRMDDMDQIEARLAWLAEILEDE